MHEHHQDDPETLSELQKLGYDPRDVPVEKTWIHAVLLYVGVAASMVFAWFVMTVFDRAQVGRPEKQEVRATTPQEPYPVLQTNTTARTDINDLRHEERVKRDTAGWVDESKGVAHIPVDTAKGLVLEELNRPQPEIPVEPEVAP